MEAKEVRYVGKLQKGTKFFNVLHTHTQQGDRSKGAGTSDNAEESSEDGGERNERRTPRLNPPSQKQTFHAAEPRRRNQIINPKTTDLGRKLADPLLKHGALRRLLDDCFRIMGPQNTGSLACGRK